MAGEREFEKKMNRLAEIVALLEKGEISLEESISLYREGMECSAYCKKELENARHEIESADKDSRELDWDDDDEMNF